MHEFISRIRIDFWTIWGLASQGIFFSRFILQWIMSEKRKRVVIPKAFWYLSLLGACMILVYAIARADIVFLITGVLQLGLYSRNLVLANKEGKEIVTAIE